MIPAEVPPELFDLAYTVTEGSQVIYMVMLCRMCKSLVPDTSRDHHRKYHEDMAVMLAGVHQEEAG